MKKNLRLSVGIIFLLVFVLIFNMFAPAIKVIATSYGEGNYKLRVNVNNDELSNGTAVIKVNNSTWGSDSDVFRTSDGKNVVTIVVTAQEGYIGGIRLGGGLGELIGSPLVDDVNNTYTYTLNINAKNNDESGNVTFNEITIPENPSEYEYMLSIYPYSQVKNNEGTGPEMPGSGNEGGETHNQRTFNGEVYFAWNDRNGGFHYHLITGIPGFDEVNGTYPVKYINSSTIVDDVDHTTKWEFGQKPYEFCWKEDFEQYLGSTEFANNQNKFDGILPAQEDGFAVDPCGAKDGANSISTNGDRNFRLTIINDSEGSTYEGVKVGTTGSYFPGFWDRVFYSDVTDISETTKSNPATIESYLLSDTVTLESDGIGSQITDIKALDVPSGAVSVTKSGSKYNIKFNSNYYDKVVFEVTSGTTKYFVRIARVTLQVHDNFGPNCTNPKITATFFYPNTSSYNQYEVYANIEYSNGKIETKKLSAAHTDIARTMEMANVTIINDNEYNGGTGLKAADYEVAVENYKAVKTIKFNVIKAGSFNTDVYGGTVAGSGDGITYNVLQRRIVY